MGAAIKKFRWKRNDLVISTKTYWGATNGLNPIKNVGLSRKHIVEGVDLVYAHRPDRDTRIARTGIRPSRRPLQGVQSRYRHR
jgi:aryl-alcohol dehydrogenase-like predicted oxidoreductase